MAQDLHNDCSDLDIFFSRVVIATVMIIVLIAAVIIIVLIAAIIIILHTAPVLEAAIVF